LPHSKTKVMQGKVSEGTSLSDRNAPALVNDFLGAAHVFAAAMNAVLEEDLLRDASYGQLSISQMKLLKLIGLNEYLTVGDAASFLKVSKAAASKAVDKLVRKMYLLRSPGRLDRRETCLSLTDASRKLLSTYEAAREQKLKEIFSMSVPAELHQVSALLDCLTARIAIENFSAQPGKLCLQCGTYFRESCLLRTQLGRECFHLRKK
jgi:DNA-binding MarR family transcriptional regulator